MSLQEFFYMIFSVAMIVIAGSIFYVVIEITTTLKMLRKILDDVKDTTNDFQMIKNGVKAGILSLIVKLLGKGGEENEKR